MKSTILSRHALALLTVLTASWALPSNTRAEVVFQETEKGLKKVVIEESKKTTDHQVESAPSQPPSTLQKDTHPKPLKKAPQPIEKSEASKMEEKVTMNAATTEEAQNPEPMKEETGFWSRPTLTSPWGDDARQKAADHGVNFEFLYTAEIGSNVSGGIAKDIDYLDNLDLVMDIDSEKLAGYKGGTLHLYGLSNFGASPSEDVGDAQGVSNIDGPDRITLIEAWYEQALFDDKFTILMGIYDANSEFDALEYGSLFLNSSHGMGPDFSQTGISAFPNTALGARFKINPPGILSMNFAVLDAVPGDPADDEAVAIDLEKSEGAVILSEIQFLMQEASESNPYGKFALGFWGYTAKADDLENVDGDGNPIRNLSNFGFYGLGEYQVYREAEDQGLGVFARIGYANPNIHQFNYYLGGGLHYTELFPSRDEDSIGLALAHVINGTKFKRVQEVAASPVERSESNIELTYRAQILPWLALQPDLQYIINPGMAPDVSNAIYLANRLEVNF